MGRPFAQRLGSADHLGPRQGRKPVLGKLEQTIQASDGEDDPGRGSNTTERQPVPALIDQPLDLLESGKPRTTHNLHVREINDDITGAPTAQHGYDSLQLVVLLQLLRQTYKDHIFRPTLNAHSTPLFSPAVNSQSRTS